MFGNQNNQSSNGGNNFNQVNVTTKLYSSYSDDSALIVSAWNEQISIRLNPFRGKSPEGVRLYAQDNNECIMTALTMDNVSALLEGIYSVIYPALVDKKSANVAIIIGSTANKKTLVISTDGNDVFMTVYVGVGDDNSAKAENSITHKFNKKEWIKDYNPSNGEGEIHEANADFIAFKEKLNEVYKLSSAIVHAFKKNDAYKNSYSGSNRTYNNSSNAYYQASVANAGTSNMSDFIPFN